MPGEEHGGRKPAQGSWECGFQTSAPAVPPSAPLSWSGTLNERSSCLLLDLLAVKKETGVAQMEEIRWHLGLGRRCAVIEKRVEFKLARSILQAKGEQGVSAASFRVDAEGCQADSPSPTARVTAAVIGVSRIYRVCTMAQCYVYYLFHSSRLP